MQKKEEKNSEIFFRQYWDFLIFFFKSSLIIYQSKANLMLNTNQTQKKLRILSDEDDADDGSQTPSERSDEFLRNFFIKFGMRKTLESF